MSGIYADPNTKYVGIGTTAPLQKLHLVGDALVSGHVLPGACNVYNLGSADSRWKDLYLSGNTIDLGGTFLKRDEESGGIKIQSESGESVDTNVRNLNASGYVDINGTRLARHITGPLMVQTATGEMESGMFKHVYVDGTVRASNLEILGDFVKMNTVTSNTEQMVIENAGTGPALKVTQTGANSIAEFYDDGSVLALKIANGGNVGIGITNPFSKLHLEGNMQATELVIAGTQFVGPTYLGATKPTYSFAGDNNTGIFGPDFDNVGISCGGTERVRVLSNGNVGIGTYNPLATLTAFGNGQASLSTFNTSTLGGALQVCDSSSAPYNGGAVVFGTYQGNFAAIKAAIQDGTTNTVGHLSFYTRNAVTDATLTNRMVIQNNGNVGIGTTNPQAKLHVEGTLLGNQPYYSAYIHYYGAMRLNQRIGHSRNISTNISSWYYFNNGESYFQPQLRGAYYVYGDAIGAGAASGGGNGSIQIRKNNSVLTDSHWNTSEPWDGVSTCAIVVMNGTTDFIDLYCSGRVWGNDHSSIVIYLLSAI